MGGDQAANEALKLEAGKTAAGPPARLRELIGAPTTARQPTELSTCGLAERVRRSHGQTAWWSRV
jgi:hypothetical protein